MISGRLAQLTDQRPIQVNLSIQIPDRFMDVVMQLLTRATVGFQPDTVFTQTGSTPAPLPPPIPGPVSPAGPQPDSPAIPQPAAPQSMLEIYRQRLKPRRQRNAGTGTIGDHETSAKQFDEFLLSLETLHRFVTPVQCLADHPELLMEFARMRLLGGNSVVTVGRRLTHLAMICKSAGVVCEKPTKGELLRIERELSDSKVAAGVIAADAGAVAADQQQQPAQDNRRIPSFAEIDALARHVNVTRYPYGDHAPYFWRGWIRYLALFGPRGRDVVSVLPTKTGLRKVDVIRESLCPIADVNNALGRELHSPHGWLWYRVGKDHHSECQRVLFPMPKWLRDWLTFWTERSWHAERVFPAAQHGATSLSQGPLSEAWNAMLTAANVDRRLIPSEGKGEKIALRKYAANWWYINALQRANDKKLADDVSFYVLHHAETTTAAKHYLSVQATVLPLMIDLLSEWPKPAADAPRVSLLPE